MFLFSFSRVNTNSIKTIGSKRQRISTETDHDTGSESSPSSPRLKGTSFNMPISSSPNQNGRPSSPESDLDVGKCHIDIALTTRKMIKHIEHILAKYANFILSAMYAFGLKQTNRFN